MSKKNKKTDSVSVVGRITHFLYQDGKGLDCSQQVTFFLLFSGLVYLELFLVEPARRYIGDNDFVLNNKHILAIIAAGLTANAFLYILVYHLIGRIKVSFRHFFGVYAVFAFVLAFVWPIGSDDIFSYVYQGRILSIHHANPFINSYDQFSHDQFYPAISNYWSGSFVPYGPLFVYCSAMSSWLGQSSIWLSLILFKTFMVLAHLFSVYLVYKISNFKTFFLYALNPLVIFEFIINGHNDALVVLAVVLSIYFLRKYSGMKGQLLACLFLLISALIKLPTVLLWPFLGIMLFWDNFKKKQGLVFTLMAIGLTVGSLIVAYAPVFSNFQAIAQPIINQSKLSEFYSPGILLIFFMVNIFQQADAIDRSVLLGRLVFVGIYGYIFLKTFLARGVNYQDNFIKMASWVMTCFCLIFMTFLLPWYFGLPMILCMLSFDITQEKRYLYVVYFFTFYGILHYLILR